MKLKKLLFLFVLVLPGTVLAQFAPAAGQPGTTAIYKDSSAFVGWAVSCKVKRGYINIEDTTETYTHGDTTSNRAFFGSPANALGKPGSSSDVVSLGDGGSATLTFDHPITNGPGPDFAVFENGFKEQSGGGYYLELAFVEVSTDGKHFVRFPSVSLTQDTVQIGGFGVLDPAKIHNLAGKYVLNYGTPFDLSDLADSSGIDIDSINYVRIVDVVGDINPAYARHDSRGNIINDPWPTDYWTGGFDLNAVGVIHEKNITGIVPLQDGQNDFIVFPNPADRQVVIENKQDEGKGFYFVVFSLAGKIMTPVTLAGGRVVINTSRWPNGLYVLKIRRRNGFAMKKFIVCHK